MPQAGRFCGEDIIKGNLEDPASLNRYTYCYNDPVKYVDLDGNNPSRAVKRIVQDEKNEHYNRNDISDNDKLSQNEWISNYPSVEKQIIADAQNQKSRVYLAQANHALSRICI